MRQLWDDDGHLGCPACGGTHLHHCDIFAYCPPKEDAPQTVVVCVHTAGSEPKIKTLLEESKRAANPSSRRDGVAIRFWCEGCPRISELTLAQHKGQTIVAWRPAEMRREPTGEIIGTHRLDSGELCAAASSGDQGAHKITEPLTNAARENSDL